MDFIYEVLDPFVYSQPSRFFLFMLFLFLLDFVDEILLIMINKIIHVFTRVCLINLFASPKPNSMASPSGQ